MVVRNDTQSWGSAVKKCIQEKNLEPTLILLALAPCESLATRGTQSWGCAIKRCIQEKTINPP
jgi:hypothetical protein